MSKNEKQNLTENKQISKDKQNGNVEVDKVIEGNAIQLSHVSEIADENLQKEATEGIHVSPSDVIIIEQLSHELLGESSSEDSECNVIYEFPSEDENSSNVSGNTDCKVTFEFMIDRDNENINQLSKASAISSHKFAQVSGIVESCSILHVDDKLIETHNTKNFDKHVPEVPRNLGEADRKRKKGLNSLMQNKKQKEVGSSSNRVREIGSSDHSSDEFADIEDNLKDSVSPDNSDLNVTIEAKEQLPLKKIDSDVEQKNRKNDEFLSENECSMVNFGESSSCSTNSTKIQSVDKAGEKSLYSTPLKGETVPLIMFSDDMKKKFELSMPTILEARESESDEQISHPMQPKSNTLKMKTSVVKRKDKCHVCNARLGLCAIKCRCGGYYCAKHRYDKEHNCTFDYKSMGAVEIEKNNPRVVAEKIRKL